MTSFPIGSSVLLQNLVKGAHLNDKKGIVKNSPDATTGRQEVYVFEAQKSMAIKPTNLRYEPRELSSLSISEMEGLLISKTKDDEDENKWKGMDKEQLRQLVIDEIDTEDPAEIAALVAKANEPKGGLDTNNKVKNNATNQNPTMHSSQQLRQGAERMSQMSPDDIRRQAATMKAMGPAALRACTPQMASMTDAQINMAIAQMEAVANNPSQLKMAAEQMKNMNDNELRQAVDQSPLMTATPSSSSSASTATPTTSATNNLKSMPLNPTATINPNVSKSQFQQATQQISTMSPDQLRNQANMLKSLPLETLRKSNPAMARMSDAQIQMSIAQLEQMAENPSMVKMAADSMKNMTEEQYESMKDMIGGGGRSGGSAMGGSVADGTPGGNGMAAGFPTDPSKMVEQILSNPEQLNSMVKTMKQNPEMMKQMMASTMGVGRGGEGDNNKDSGATSSGNTAKREQMEKAIDSFAEMDDEKLERYLKMANKVQSVAKPVYTTFDKVKQTLGVSTVTLLVLINLGILASFVLLARWWKMRGGDGVGIEMEGNDLLAHVGEDTMPEIMDYEKEF